MQAPHRAEVAVICDCGHHHYVAFDAIRERITCPACGRSDRFDGAKIARIEDAFGVALAQAAQGIADGESRAVGEASTRR